MRTVGICRSRPQFWSRTESKEVEEVVSANGAAIALIRNVD